MNRVALFFVSIFLLVSCTLNRYEQEELISPTQSATQVVVSVTSQPTATFPPTVTKTITPTSLPTVTPIGGGQGRVIFLRDDDNAENWDIFSMNSNGTGMQQLTFWEGVISHPVWSPAGEKIAFSYRETKDAFSQLYVMNPDGSEITKISTDDGRNYSTPDWSPDSTKIAFSSGQSNSDWEIFIMNADGSDEVQITDGASISYGPDWSPDGTIIAFVSMADYQPEIFVMNSDGTDPKPITSLGANIGPPKWSPDGEYIVFQSQKDEKKEWEIYLMRSDGTDLVQITDNDTWDLRPRFSLDGTKISWDSCCFNLSIMNLDGSDVEKLNSQFGWDYDWQP